MTKRSLIVATVVIVALLVLAPAAYNDYASCARGNDVRATSHSYYIGVEVRTLARAKIDVGTKRALDHQAHVAAVRAARGVEPLSCSLPFPST